MVNDTSIPRIASRSELAEHCETLRSTFEASSIPTETVLRILDAWSHSLNAPELSDIPGLAFLRLWLRRTTLESMINRELGESFLKEEWDADGMARFRAFPLGIVGHWPAGNVEIQPFISLVCGLLGGNAAIVRVPNGLVTICEQIWSKLHEVDSENELCPLIRLVAFDYNQRDIQEEMASRVDGAMIWGGEDAVLANRSLPFPHWCRIALFGPRISVAFMDKGVAESERERKRFSQRMARDVWQFDQMACSSPQVLFVEKNESMDFLINSLEAAFTEENRVHPRSEIDASLTANIVVARAEWLFESSSRSAVFPSAPDWTILRGQGEYELPEPVQGRTLFVLEVEDLDAAVLKLDGNVQTMGLAFLDREREERIISIACRRGVDRVVKLGRMHVFDSPWDGRELIKPMMRTVRYLPSA